ncbi:hypothetical protein [Microbaculum marinum]|uniref:Uncharacterized protein n=1 Tax=Microbaculum marinum TaxID=1764581 RepID=A0AAW9RXD3_9HYPH
MAQAREEKASTTSAKKGAPEPGGGEPTAAQRAYLQRGLGQPGGKLPLFGDDGRQINHRTIGSCIANGWAEPWFNNPIKPDWLVCRLTESGYRALGETPPGG